MTIVQAEKFMIIVTGAPAAGKTTLSRDLAFTFNVPVINKDDIKELLYDSFGTQDDENARAFGVACFGLMYLIAEKLCQTGKAFILEGNFENQYSSKRLSNILAKYNYQALQIHCHAPIEVLYERYVRRDESGERHQGHSKLTCGFDAYKKLLQEKNYKLEIDGCLNIDLETSSYEEDKLQQVHHEVSMWLNDNVKPIRVITLCGSTKFMMEFRKAEAFLTLQGHIVITLGFFEQYEGKQITQEQKRLFEILHMHKIDMSDEVFVIDVNGYIGESTKNEIEYAKSKGKTIRFYSETLMEAIPS